MKIYIEDLANVLKMATSTQMQLTMIPMDNRLNATKIIEIIAQSTLNSLQVGILHDFDCPESDNILKAVIKRRIHFSFCLDPDTFSLSSVPEKRVSCQNIAG